MATITAIEFGLSEQGAKLGLAARGKERQSVKRARQGALLDEFRAALAEPAGQLQTRIVIGAHKAEAIALCPFEVVKGTSVSGPNLLASDPSKRLILVGSSARALAIISACGSSKRWISDPAR